MEYAYYSRVHLPGRENGAVVNYWTPENPSNDFPHPRTSSSFAALPYSSTLAYVDGSFLKIRNISLGYNLPKPFLSKYGVNGMRIYVTGKNLFTFSKIDNYDVERGGAQRSAHQTGRGGHQCRLLIKSKRNRNNKNEIMKRIIIYLLIITTSLVLATACNKKLEEYNPGGLTADVVFNTPAGFEAGVSAAYSYNRHLWGKEAGYHLYEASSDLWMSGVDDPNTEITQFTNGLNSNNAIITANWQRLYSVINLCNALIARVPQSGLSDALKATREAELRMLRAWYYYTIVETWGGVHFTLEETKGIVTAANRKPVDTFTMRYWPICAGLLPTSRIPPAIMAA